MARPADCARGDVACGHLFCSSANALLERINAMSSSQHPGAASNTQRQSTLRRLPCDGEVQTFNRTHNTAA